MFLRSNFAGSTLTSDFNDMMMCEISGGKTTDYDDMQGADKSPQSSEEMLWQHGYYVGSVGRQVKLS
jgi:hypothetical protein